MNEETENLKQKFCIRAKYIYFAGIVIAFCIIATIGYKQYSPKSYALRKISSGYINFKEVIEPAKRGNIYSYNGKLLATTQTLYHIYMDFNAQGMSDEIFSQNVRGLAKGLSKFFRNKSAARYESELRLYRKKKLSYKRITPRKVNHLELIELRKLPLWNLGVNKGGRIEEKIYERDNPYGSLARRTIGKALRSTTNPEGALYGIESSFNDYLAGTDGYNFIRRISGSFWVEEKNSQSVEPIDGCDIVTTIDIELQDVAEDALKKTLQKHQADWGCAILMEVETGEIRVIANIERTSSGSMNETRNFAITENMEPGSTFKLATLLAVLDDAGADIDEKVDCSQKRMKVGSRYYTDSGHEGYGVISIKEVFEHSSNIGFARLVEKYYGKDPYDFFDYLKKLSFLDPINLQLHGEIPPTIKSKKAVLGDKTALGMTSTGYNGVMLTPLRTLMLYNAVANDGKMMKPLFVKKITKDEETIKTFNSEVLNSKIASSYAIKNSKEALEGVVYDGTGRTVLLNKYYKIAGKTGTAQIFADGGYHTSKGTHYLGSFAGYFPADKPKYSCIVAIKTFIPTGYFRKVYYGGSLAGPVFKAIADRVYTHAIDWGYEIERPVIKPKKGKITDTDNSPENEIAPIKAKNGDLKKTKKSANYLDISKKQIIFADKETLNEKENKEYSQGVMPNLYGMGLNDALEITKELGLRVISHGKGKITSQSIKSGEKPKRGDTLYINLSL